MDFKVIEMKSIDEKLYYSIQPSIGVNLVSWRTMHERFNWFLKGKDILKYTNMFNGICVLDDSDTKVIVIYFLTKEEACSFIDIINSILMIKKLNYEEVNL